MDHSVNLFPIAKAWGDVHNGLRRSYRQRPLTAHQTISWRVGTRIPTRRVPSARAGMRGRREVEGFSRQEQILAKKNAIPVLSSRKFGGDFSGKS